MISAENNEIQKEVQGLVNNFQMNNQWLSSVPCVFFSIIAGALSDEFGRKPLILLPLVGSFAGFLLNVIHSVFRKQLPAEFILTDAVAAFFGGTPVYYLGIYSYCTTASK